MWEWLGPLITKALDNMTVESVGDWGTCFATASVRILSLFTYYYYYLPRTHLIQMQTTCVRVPPQK